MAWTVIEVSERQGRVLRSLLPGLETAGYEAIAADGL
jgi:hypothetical protein